MIMNQSVLARGQLVKLAFKRYSSSCSHNDKYLAKIYAFPITRDKSYLHFEYNEKLINVNSPLVKYENRAVSGAANLWNKMQQSDKPVNQKIVRFVSRFIERIPWTEDSLRSIPSRSALLRQVKTHGDDGTHADKSPLLKPATAADGEELEGIPVFYPAHLMTPVTLSKEIDALCQQATTYHKKQMLLTGIGVPLSLPIALVPVVPNVPGFYLAYRFYCNTKAYIGGLHLDLFNKNKELIYKDEPLLDDVYESVRENEDDILLNESIVQQLVDTFKVDGARTGLLKALRQEIHALEKIEEDQKKH